MNPVNLFKSMDQSSGRGKSAPNQISNTIHAGVLGQVVAAETENVEEMPVHDRPMANAVHPQPGIP